MRAVQITDFGGPEVLEVVELAAPAAAPGQVAIAVTRAGINFADLHQRTNSYVGQAELPFVPGAEVAGVREDTGERVVAICGIGGYAERVVVAEEQVFPVPEAVDDDTALALLIQGLTAWHLYATSARLAPGESVVVHSASGGTGSLAVQLAKPLGAGRVIATASSEDKRELALELGADAAIDGGADNLLDRLVEANEGRLIDVVLDAVGGAVFDASLRALAPFGRLVTYGISTREQNSVRTGHLLRHSRAVVGFYLFHLPPERMREAADDLFARAMRGEIRAVAGGTYPLSEAARAHEDLAARRTTGKLLLDPTR